MAVCQPCVPALAAAAIMAEDDVSSGAEQRDSDGRAGGCSDQPRIGERLRDTDLACLLERTVIQKVPLPYRGAGRRVYPGFLQAMGFIRMDPRRHAAAFAGLLRDTANGDERVPPGTKTFYDEYFAVLDIAAEFYSRPRRQIFTRPSPGPWLPEVDGRDVDPSAIRTALLDGRGRERRDVPARPDKAAHGLCTGIPAARKQHHLQPGVGHYGVFNGTSLRPGDLSRDKELHCRVGLRA